MGNGTHLGGDGQTVAFRKKGEAPLFFRRRSDRIFWILCLLGFMVASPSLGLAEPPSFHGSLSNRLKFRTTGGYHDTDLETLLTLDIGQPQTDKFSGALQAGGIFDLDSNPSGTPFRSVYDTFGRAVGRLYYAYLDIKEVGPIKNVRVGRQHRYEFEGLYYDGVTLETDPFHKFTLTAFGGVPVHQFENQIGFDVGDWMVGGALQWNPRSNVQARLDYVHLRDKESGFRVGAGNQQDDLFGATVWWEINPHVSLTSRFTSFSDQVRDVQLLSNFSFPEKDLTVRLDFFRLLKGYDIRVIELDAYRIAGQFLPYTQVSLSATQGLGKNFALDGGFSARLLDHDQIAGAFNHGFERIYLSFSTFDLPLKGFSLTATGDYYRGEDNTLRNDNFGGSLYLSQKLLKDRLTLNAGTAYYLYRFNLFTGNESNNVQTYFAGVRGKILKNLEGRLSYEFEHNPINNFHTLDTRLIWSF